MVSIKQSVQNGTSEVKIEGNMGRKLSDEENSDFGQIILRNLTENPDFIGMEWNSESIIKDNIVMGRKQNEENPNFGQTILSTISQHPDLVGMINAHTGEKVKFGKMKDRSVRCALWLQKQGISENDVVGLSTPIQMNDYVPYLATLYINAIVNPWLFNASSENAQHFFETCRPKVMFACKDSIDKLVQIAKDKGMECKFITFDKHEEHSSLEEIMAEQTQDEVDAFECVVPLEPRKKISRIIFTSGTTGMPKAIMLPYYSVLKRVLQEFNVAQGSICLWYSPFAWIAGGTFILSAIHHLCTRVVHREFEAEETASISEKYKVNFIFLWSYLLTQCYQARIFRRYDFTSVKIISFSGTKMNRIILEECQKSLPHTLVAGIYGLTEAGGMVLKQTKNCKNLDSAGYVCSGMKLKVVDLDTGVALGPNQEGQMYFQTDNAMLGYFKNPKGIESIMDEDGWLRSGDLGSYDENGEVIITGRLKALIKTKSLSISPTEIEEILMQHPTVKDCAVVGVEHPIDIERPFAFVVKASDVEVTAEQLIEFTKSKSERYCLTGGLVFIDELPLTHTGKKCLRELQQMAKVYLLGRNNV